MDRSVKRKVPVGTNLSLGMLGTLTFRITVSVVLKVVVDEMLSANGSVREPPRTARTLVLVKFSVTFIRSVTSVQGKWTL